MTRTTNARIAGFTFLFYIAAGVASMILFGRSVSGDGTAAKLVSIGEHSIDVRIAVMLTLLCCFSALVLAVTLYGITRHEDHELAVMVLACRLSEGVLGAVGLLDMLALRWLATVGTGANAPDAATTNALGTFLLRPGVPLGAIFFAVGSVIFSYLLLRGRLVPSPLAWLGILASILLVVGLPLEVTGLLEGAFAWYMWAPMLAFEVPLGLWFLLRGVAAPASPLAAR